ncbi:MAG: hypothetical protein U0670_07450 [Anaerolineae bacterium]
MQPQVLIDNEFITLRYLPDEKIVHHTIHKPIDYNTLGAAMELGLKVLQENGASKWLSDDRLNGPVVMEDTEINRDWGKRMVAAGWRYWANIVPEEIVAADSLVPIIETFYEIGLRMMVFTNADDALAWLKSV